MLGRKTGLVTKIGRDMPKELLQPVVESGIDTTGIQIVGDCTRTTILEYDPEGNKRARFQKTAPELTVEDLPQSYLTAKAFLVCPMDFEVSDRTVRRLSQQVSGKLVADLGGFGGAPSSVHPVSDGRCRNAFEKVVRHFDVIKASLEDCWHIFGRNINPRSAVEILSSYGATIVLLTLGSNGSIFWSKNEGIRTVPTYPGRVIDTTGAGDVYIAAFVSELVRSGDHFGAALFAAAAASIIIEKSGGAVKARMPTDVEVRRRLVSV
jgi:sugar/nucleoside kinase (ribokinase family)